MKCVMCAGRNLRIMKGCKEKELTIQVECLFRLLKTTGEKEREEQKEIP